MGALAEKVSQFSSHFQFRLLNASLMIEIDGDGCYEKVRFDGLEYLRYEIDQVQGELKSFDCAIIVHDCGAEISEEEGLYVSLPRGKRRGEHVFKVELFVNNDDFQKFRHLADIMILDERYDLEFYLPFAGVAEIGNFPSDDIVYDMAGMRFELERQKRAAAAARRPVKPARGQARSR
jgi:hypothetical protein